MRASALGTPSKCEARLPYLAVFEEGRFFGMIQAKNSELYFCMDGGDSRSRSRFVDIEGRTLTEATEGPCNPSINLERAVASVVGLWSQCCSVIGRPNSQFEGVAFAVSAAGNRAPEPVWSNLMRI
jgi:N-acetylglucosamine kinase-like BadF-type ATPase